MKKKSKNVKILEMIFQMQYIYISHIFFYIFNQVVHLIRGLQFVLVGEMMGKKTADNSRRNCSKFYITAIDELEQSKDKFRNFKYYKNICSFIDCVNQMLKFHANFYFAFDISLTLPLNDEEIGIFASKFDDVIFKLLSSESSFNYLYKYTSDAIVYIYII